MECPPRFVDAARSVVKESPETLMPTKVPGHGIAESIVAAASESGRRPRKHMQQ